MSSLSEGRAYAMPRESSDSYRTRNAAQNEFNEPLEQQRMHTAYDSGNSNGQRQQRFMGSLPDNAKLSQGSLTQMPDGTGRDQEKSMVPATKEKSHTGEGKATKPQRICGSCGESLTGQFVRALDSTFHLECFKCRDCGEVVASKFFPVEDESGQGQYPLCETDYFRRLELLCHNCGGALRGSYVTALDHKYHIDHFTCSVCPTAFGPKDSYYEHDGRVYCHYHYSTRFAQRCNGCQTAILKQFVEIFRNGQNQHWHPECYMIHKFWNVRLSSSTKDINDRGSTDEEASQEKRMQVKVEEEQMEEKTYHIWSVLSAFEETSASCISDMLLHVSNGAYMEGVLVAKRFITHVDILFSALDRLDACVIAHGMNGLSYGREAKLLCKRIVAFFRLLTKTQDIGVKRLGVTQELLSLVTGLAHYLKLLIRIGLQGALKLEKERQTNEGLNIFLEDLGRLGDIKENSQTLDETSSLSELADKQSDECLGCRKPVDDECLKLGHGRVHFEHAQCSGCKRNIGDEMGLNNAIWLESENKVLCPNCSRPYLSDPSAVPIEHVTRLQQYVFLLRVALARLLSVLRSGGNLPHTSDDPNLNAFNSEDGHRLDSSNRAEPSMLNADMRSKSFGGTTGADADRNQSSYQETVGEMKRFRSTRMDKHLSSTMRQARRSRIIPDAGGPGQNPFRIEDEQDTAGPIADLTTHQDMLTLDDIPKIVAAQQVKEQRPNAYRHAKDRLVSSGTQPKLLSGGQRDATGAQDESSLGGAYPRERTKRYFSELTALEYFIVRHVAVLQMQPLMEGHFTLEDLLSLIEMRKPTFWNKFFKGNDKSKGGKKKGVFGVNLEVLVEREGVESDHGIGPGALRVPSLIDDSVTAMRQMDMSVEGVFRKNGNIRGLKDLAERIDSKEGDVDLAKESPVQVAALLKKFLREMPDPLLTHKLHDLFTTSQKIQDDTKRRRVLHLTCCLLPKVNRDSLEVLFSFLNWAASFSQVDEETGSKMDTHNLATVIAPNILSSDTKGMAMDESFLAIEAVHMLLDCNDEMCEVPEDIQSVLSDSELFNNMPDLTTKEILKRYGEVAKQPDRHFGSVKPEAADMLPVHTADSPASAASRANVPVATRIDGDPHQVNAWQMESSVRHVQQNGSSSYPPGNQKTPPQQYHDSLANPNSAYHRRGGSGESAHSHSTPTKHGLRLGGAGGGAGAWPNPNGEY